MTELKISFESQFKLDLKKHFLIPTTAEWAKILYCLTKKLLLPKKYSDYFLTGDWIGFRECHIKLDVLLIYDNTGGKLSLIRLGTHSDLFG